MRPGISLLIGTATSCLVLAGAWAESKAPPKQESGEAAVFTFSGKRGKPVKIIDHRTETVTVHDEYRFVNQSTEQAMSASDARRAASRDAEAAIEAERAAAQAADAAAAESAPADAPTGDAAEAMPVEQGLQLLRANNFVTFSSDNRRYPTQVFNQDTRQFVPTEEALKTVQQPAQSTSSSSSSSTSSSTPPRARVVDPTP